MHGLWVYTLYTLIISHLQTLMKLGHPEDILRYGMFFAAIFIHKYFIFLPGQKIINYSLEVFDYW